MSSLSSLPSFPSFLTSEQQAEQHLADEEAIDQAEQDRLIAYLADEQCLIATDDEDTHSCGDSECQGAHVHANDDDCYADDDYECGHRSPVADMYDMYGYPN
jgi:hypothetical protein